MQEDVRYQIEKKVYNIRFSNLVDLYDYLIKEPKINSYVFSNPASSNCDSFYGEPLEQAVEYCISGYKKNFENFLTANDELKKTTKDNSENRILTRSIYGGVPLSSLVAAGVPDCVLRYERDNKSTVRNIYFNLAYPSDTKTSQIINRGLAVLYIIQALEARGEMINFKAFFLAHHLDEMINIEIVLKKPGDMFLDVQKCYFPLVGKEFLRRVLFRVMESSSVQERYWGIGYGTPANQGMIRDFYQASHSDFIISSPKEMGIIGDCIYDDTISLIENLNLKDEFDINKIKELKGKSKIKKY